MPPNQNLLASIYGRILCKTCLSKLLELRQRKSLKLRSISNQYAYNSNYASGRVPPRLDREVHFYDQTPDGERVERFVDKDYEDKVEGGYLDADLKQTIEENMPTMRKMFRSSIPNEYQIYEGLERFEDAGKKFKAFADKVKSAGKLEELSFDERERLREDLIKLNFFGILLFLSKFRHKLISCAENSDEQDLHDAATNRERRKDIDDVEEKKNLSEVNTDTVDLSELRKHLASETIDSDFQHKNRCIEGDQSLLDRQTLRRFPVTSFPKPYQGHITLLQDCLDACFEHNHSLEIRGEGIKVTKDMLRKHLARAYIFARKGLLTAPDSVPLSMWQDLWKILQADTNENLNRLTYIKRLGQDMDELGLPMTISQRLVYVEALFLDGARKSAVIKWQEARPRREDPIWDEYWEIGIRILAQLGRFNQALKIAEAYFQDVKKPSRYRALMPLIRACLISRKDLFIQHAWALYLRLKANLGKEMIMKDYDVLISWFMDSEQPDLALAIFRDMMISNDPSASAHDSIAVQKISGIMADIQGVKIHQSELQWENTRALSILPAKLKNKYFFGSWIKKLIGDDELDSAKKVLDLMQDHGITPSPMHMNGLIGAWFRRGNENDFTTADNLAWRMINRRLEYMDIRDFQHSLESPLRPNLNGRSIGDKSALIFPMATIETFCLLVQQYRQRQKKNLLPTLFDAFTKSRIPPNTKYLNQIILTDTRNHKTSLAFETYRILTARGVRPDYETFILLWNLMKISVDPSVGRKVDWQSSNVGTCRQLFAELMKWKPSLKTKHVFPRELYDLIILSFSLKQDNVGAAVALRALQKEFDMFPDENCIRTIVLQLARYGLRNKVGMKPRRLNLSLPVTKNRIGDVMQLFEIVKRGRAEYLEKRGINPDSLSIEARKEESIIMSIELLRCITSIRLIGENRNNTSCSSVAEQAAKQMNVPNCNIWQETSHMGLQQTEID